MEPYLESAIRCNSQQFESLAKDPFVQRAEDIIHICIRTLDTCASNHLARHLSVSGVKRIREVFAKSFPPRTNQELDLELAGTLLVEQRSNLSNVKYQLSNFFRSSKEHGLHSRAGRTFPLSDVSCWKDVVKRIVEHMSQPDFHWIRLVRGQPLPPPSLSCTFVHTQSTRIRHV